MGQLDYFLEIEVQRIEDDIHMNQKIYIREVLEKAQLYDAKIASTPISIGKILFKIDGKLWNNIEATQYWSLLEHWNNVLSPDQGLVT